MSPELKEVLLEAIKILGPATITAIVAYQAGKAQLTIKLKELEKTNEFKAREHLFNYYQEQSREMREGRKKLYSSMGQYMGVVSGLAIDGEESVKDLKELGGFLLDFSALIPIEIQNLKKQLENEGFAESVELKTLDSCAEKLKQFEREHSPSAIRKNIILFLEILNGLNSCEVLLLEKHRKEVFKPYLQ